VPQVLNFIRTWGTFRNSELFGWTFETGDQEMYGGYISAAKNGKAVAGIMPKQEDQAGMPDAWSTYLAAEDAAATATAVAEHGGQVLMEPMDVPDAKDYPAAVRFYQDVFGWETEVMADAPDFKYTTLGAGDAARAGIIDASLYLPEQIPSHWQVYFGVEDTDASVAKAVSMGASVLEPAQDSPFGRVATLADPTGATFKIIEALDQGGQADQGA
jgi:predicted enzyme related to lactoylglutathione lyase